MFWKVKQAKAVKESSLTGYRQIVRKLRPFSLNDTCVTNSNASSAVVFQSLQHGREDQQSLHHDKWLLSAGMEILPRLFRRGISHPWVLMAAPSERLSSVDTETLNSPLALVRVFKRFYYHKACKSHSLHIFIQNSWHLILPPHQLSPQSFNRRGWVGF